jgi:hypothetical protein
MCTAELLAPKISLNAVTVLVTAQLALAQIIVFLPTSLSKRGLLGALAITPIMGFFQVNRVVIWKAEGGL